MMLSPSNSSNLDQLALKGLRSSVFIMTSQFKLRSTVTIGLLDL